MFAFNSQASADSIGLTPEISSPTPTATITTGSNRHLLGAFTLLGSQTNNQGSSNQTTSGVGVSALLDFQNNKTSFETGLAYGSSVQTRGNTQKFTHDLKTLSIPLAIKYYVRTNKHPLVYLKGGFNPTFLLSATHQDTGSNTSSFGNQGFTLQGVAGAGLKIKLDESKDLNIEGLYLRHISTIATNLKMWDEALQIGIGVGIGF